MKTRLVHNWLVAALIVAALSAGSCDREITVGPSRQAGRTAQIQPDYCDTVIPPNIAPLNFLIREPGSQYYVKIHSEQGDPVEIAGRSPKIRIPPAPWRKLLESLRQGPGRPVDAVRSDNESDCRRGDRSFPLLPGDTSHPQSLERHVYLAAAYRELQQIASTTIPTTCSYTVERRTALPWC